MHASDRDTHSELVLDEGTAITAFRMFVRQTGITRIIFGHSSPVVGAGDVAGWAFSLSGEKVSALPRDGSVTTPCGVPIRIHIDDMGGKFIARLFPCGAPIADVAGQTMFF